MIVLCNDDGFQAGGIRAIYKELVKSSEVVIVAPETEQSAMGHAITLTQPLKVRKVVENGEFIGYAVNGTPADCIKIATTVLFGSVPWSKFSHMFFKPAAAFEKRVSNANGSRNNLPSPADKPEIYGSARQQPHHY